MSIRSKLGTFFKVSSITLGYITLSAYDIIVVGGGHAGCEAAHISAVLGLKTALVTANIKNIADMPCNPSIGGTAKV